MHRFIETVDTRLNLRTMARELEDYGYDVAVTESGLFVNMPDGTKIMVTPDGRYTEFDLQQLAQLIISRHLVQSGLPDIPAHLKKGWSFKT